MPLVAACLALQWCAESSGAEISAASPGYQRETFFVNSSPTVSSLHSWLTARCVPLPCLHAASKALVFSNPASFYCTFLHRLVLSSQATQAAIRDQCKRNLIQIQTSVFRRVSFKCKKKKSHL